MKILIVEDDFISRRLLQRILSGYGECDIAVDGAEAVAAFRLAWESREPYALICLDIKMPGLDGHGVLEAIRTYEEQVRAGNDAQQARIVITTGLEDSESFLRSFEGGCDCFLSKPIERERLEHTLRELQIIRK